MQLYDRVTQSSQVRATIASRQTQWRSDTSHHCCCCCCFLLGFSVFNWQQVTRFVWLWQYMFKYVSCIEGKTGNNIWQSCGQVWVEAHENFTRTQQQQQQQQGDNNKKERAPVTATETREWKFMADECMLMEMASNCELCDQIVVLLSNCLSVCLSHCPMRNQH